LLVIVSENLTNNDLRKNFLILLENNYSWISEYTKTNPSQESRRLLIEDLIKQYSDRETKILINYLISSNDLKWLINNYKSNNIVEQKEIYANLILTAFNYSNGEEGIPAVDFICKLYHSDSYISSLDGFKRYFEGSKFDDEEYKETRKRYKKTNDDLISIHSKDSIKAWTIEDCDSTITSDYQYWVNIVEKIKYTRYIPEDQKDLYGRNKQKLDSFILGLGLN